MPTRKEAVTIPADLLADSRVTAFYLASGQGHADAITTVVIALGAIAKAGGDALAAGLSDVIGTVAAELFKQYFLDNGRCALYDEYNGARDRHRAANRSWREKAKRPKKAVASTTPAPSLFPEAWKAYPKRSGGNPRALAQKAWDARVKEGVSGQEMLAATKHYAAHCQQEGKVGTAFVLQGGTFYGPSRRWEDFTTPPPDPEMDDIMQEIQRSFEED